MWDIEYEDRVAQCFSAILQSKCGVFAYKSALAIPGESHI